MITVAKRVKDKNRGFSKLNSLIKKLIRMVKTEETIKENRAICILNLFFLDI